MADIRYIDKDRAGVGVGTVIGVRDGGVPGGSVTASTADALCSTPLSSTK